MVSRYYRAYGAITALAAASALWSGTGCVEQRPSRNGVFNENQYLRKDFLIAPGDGSGQDTGWFVKTTVVSATTPNVLGSAFGPGLFAGSEGGGGGLANYVRFQVTQDKLQLVNLREISNDPTNNSQGLSTPEVVNAWPITNVDLKYRINLDGEKTNFYEENQELDWQVRQWVKINFAKNDLSDLYAFGANLNPVIQNCINTVDASVSLVPDSFYVDTTDNTWGYNLNMTLPIAFDDTNAATCIQAFGGQQAWNVFAETGRQNVNIVVKTVFARPASTTVDGTYVPLPIDEKDPIQRKYGTIKSVVPYRDQNTQLLGATQYVNRFNPNKQITYYFAPGMPLVYQKFFKEQVEPMTNSAVFANTGGKLGGKTLKFLNYNDATDYGDGAGPVRQYGDPRYSFIVWHSDLDNGSQLLGVMQPFADPRTGEMISSSVNVFEGNFKDSVLQRLDLFYSTVYGNNTTQSLLNPDGSFNDNATVDGTTTGTKIWATPCKPGTTAQNLPLAVATQFNQQSTVYYKMQGYMQKPYAQYGYLGPHDFVPSHDKEFYDAFFGVTPYQIYADPQANAFVTPEGSQFATAMNANWEAFQNLAKFEALAGQIDQGLAPYDINGPNAIKDAVSFYGNWANLSQAVNDFQYTRRYSPMGRTADDKGMFDYFNVYMKNGRHCTAAGTWESRDTYEQNLITSLNMAVAVHEFGHSLGLEHNFIGSVDQRNFPLDANGNPTLYSSSIMDYNQPISEAFYETSVGTGTAPAMGSGTYNNPQLAPNVWGPYDVGALGFIYGNNLDAKTVGPQPIPAGMSSSAVSGQVSATVPWNDPNGFVSGKEIQYLFCGDNHMRYTPLCRQYDLGVTPSEIMANDLQRREWNYLWTNFRLYHKYFSTESYGATVATQFNEMRRFLSLWAFDWSQGEITNDLRLIGLQVPAGATAADYYSELTNKFDQDLSAANQLMATYHRAIIEQSSGERPYVTSYDPYYGDVTQQGIQIDKVTATGSFSELWPAFSNFDPSQSSGLYLTSFGNYIGDPGYNTVSQAVLSDYLGASYATYQYSQVGPLAAFANTTHSPAYTGSQQLQTWVGGYAFNRERDFLDFVHAIAVKYDFPNCDENGNNCNQCTSLDNCTWDPRFQQANASQITQSNRYNIFQGPDGRTYIWGYIQSRNQWVLADRDRNNATYALMLSWTTDIVNNEDDGTYGASQLEYKVRYAVDAFTYFNDNALTASGP